MGNRQLVPSLVVLASLLVAATSLAQTAADRALAEALYDEGRRLLAAGNAPEACAKLEESQRLDPATGTLLNLAACREQEGRIATAWLLFQDGAAAARRDGRADRVTYAEGKAAELGPRISHLTIEVPAEVVVEGLEVKLDGVVVRSVAWGIPTPVDGGRHVVEATAPGYQPQRIEVEIATEQEQRQLALPALAPVEVSAPAPAAAAPAAPPAVAPPPPVAARRHPAGQVGTGAYVALGITGACGVGAVVTGIVAARRGEDFATANDDPNRTVAERQDLRSDAFRMQVVNTALTGAAIVGAGVTAVLVATRPRSEEGRRVRVNPWVAREGAGLTVGGAL